MNVETRINIATNLRAERERLGLSSGAFARLTGISREGLRKYENGQRRVSAEWLADAAKLGVDGQFILTGERSLEFEIADRLAARDRP
jgi:transcriptional regulator with XRE-family HTH domain